MFNIEYRISTKADGQFIGEMGYYKMICNLNYYGDIFPEDLEDIMGTEYLYDFMRDIVIILKELHDKYYVALSNIESYNLWVEFEKKQNDISISLTHADKPDGAKKIEFEIFNRKENETLWRNEKVDFNDFKEQIIASAKEYVKEVKSNNGYKILSGIDELEYMINQIEGENGL